MSFKPKIICIDDDETNIELLINMLANVYKVVSCSDSREAIDNICQYNPDLILLDIKMPYFSGFEIAEKVKKIDQFKETPIIFLSASHDYKDEKKAFEVGGNDFILKPFIPEIVLTRIKTQIDLSENNKQIQQKTLELSQQLEKSRQDKAKIEELLSEVQHQKLEHQRAESKFITLLQSLGEGVIGIDNYSKISFINREALKLLKYEEEEILGKNIHALLHHSDKDGEKLNEENCLLCNRIQMGKLFVSKPVEDFLWTKDKQVIPIEFLVKPHIENRHITGSVITFTDITARLEAKAQLVSEIADRKQSEKMAEQAKKRLENITNNIPGVVFQVQAIDNELLLRFISHGIEALHHISESEIKNNFNHFIETIYIDDRQYVQEQFQQSIHENKPLSCEYRVLTSDNKIRWIQMKAMVNEIAEVDNDVFLFDDDDKSKEYMFNGNLIDITKEKNSHELIMIQQKEIQEIHEQTQKSIQYASLIQRTLLPDSQGFSHYFQDIFTLWEPKDIVGGDIYFAEDLRNEDEFLLMMIDCTGHGVPGAFVTMLVKAIERQIVSTIKNSNELVSPGKILSIFNNSIKHLLKQQSKESISNVGFDGSILYLNKQLKQLKIASAETPIFYFIDEKCEVFKGSRHSVGYKTSDKNYKFKEITLNTDEVSEIYLCSDGYTDQLGGTKGFPLGKRKLIDILKMNHHLPMHEQKSAIYDLLISYQQNHERNDDISMIGLRL